MSRLYRSRADKKIAGICGGIAQVYNLDPTLIRLAMVFLALMPWFTAAIIVTYLVGIIVIPPEPEHPE